MTQGDELTHAELRIPITREFARGVYDGETDGELEVPEPDEKLPAVGIAWDTPLTSYRYIPPFAVT